MSHECCHDSARVFIRDTAPAIAASTPLVQAPDTTTLQWTCLRTRLRIYEGHVRWHVSEALEGIYRNLNHYVHHTDVRRYAPRSLSMTRNGGGMSHMLL